jgi:uncharacterized protein (UPF0218 family)
VSETVVELPESLRSELKEPLGSIYTDTDELLDAVGSSPLVTVGDVVTYHVLEAGRTPTLAVADERTERAAVDEAVARVVFGHDYDRELVVTNPPATLTADLLSALAEELDGDGQTLLVVDGEEDLTVLPAILAAPDGASVVYGQPGEGMVHVPVDRQSRERARDLLSQMDGDADQLWSLLGIPA